jgi:hypothetical protein
LHICATSQWRAVLMLQTFSIRLQLCFAIQNGRAGGQRRDWRNIGCSRPYAVRQMMQYVRPHA